MSGGDKIWVSLAYDVEFYILNTVQCAYVNDHKI